VPSTKQPLRFHMILQGFGLLLILVAILAFAAIRQFNLFSWSLAVCLKYTLVPALPSGLIFVLFGLMIQKTNKNESKLKRVR